MESLLISLGVLLAYMSVLFVIGMATKNNAIADVGYGIAFMVVITATVLQFPQTTLLTLVVALLPFVWGLRLAFRIYMKNKGKPEDFRYRAWREQWGKTFVVRSFLQVYMLQGLVVFAVALPVLLAIAYPTSTTFSLVVLGIAVWLVGFFFEAVGDYQLDRFIKNPLNKVKIMSLGLWKYSRHPNYFGESAMWFGIAIAGAGLTALPLLGFVSPLLITFLLLKVSGVPLLEKHFEGNPEWEAYKARTSVFLPLPPKKR
jgi:steroid 5-alpha reductase family enzyme